MSPLVIPVILVALAVIGTGLLGTALGIYWRLGMLIVTIGDLKMLLVGSQAEFAQATEGIDRMHTELSRLVANSNKGAEIVRSVSRLPTR